VLLTAAGLHVPLMPLDDVAGNVGTTPPAHIVSVVPKVNVGVMFGFTVTLNEVFKAHCPADGVNVYVPEAVLLTVAGFHVPEIPFDDVAGNAGTVPPEQMVNEVPKVNVGVIFGFTVTVKVAVVAHCPAEGVNVYVSDVVLLTVAGFHVPVILLDDVPGNAGTDPPEQIVSDVPKLNAGVIFGFTVTVNVVVSAHCPADGVNV
jgi:hypothetical protein